MNFVITANSNYKRNLANTNYFLELFDGYGKRQSYQCFGGIDRRSGGLWEAGLCTPCLIGDDEEDPDCWTDYMIVATTPDLLEAKQRLREAAIKHYWLLRA